MDLLAVLLFLAVLAVILALWHGDPLAWVEREIELMAADFWTPEPPQLPPFTRQDPRCRRLEIRQRIAGNRLRRGGVSMRVAVSSAWLHDERAFRFVRSER